MKAKLADVTVRYRECTLPDECPKCKRDFSVGTEGIRMWEFQDQERFGFRDLEHDRFQEDDGGRIPKGGEIFVEGLAFYCGACGELLLAGEFKQDRTDLEEQEALEVGSLPHPFLDFKRDVPEGAQTKPGGLEDEH